MDIMRFLNGESKRAVLRRWTPRVGPDAARARWRAIVLARLTWLTGAVIVLLMLFLSFGVLPRSPAPVAVFCIVVGCAAVLYALATRAADSAARSALAALEVSVRPRSGRLRLPPTEEGAFASWCEVAGVPPKIGG